MFKTILLINYQEALAAIREKNFHVLQANTSLRGIEILNSQPVDCIVTTLQVPDVSGITMARLVRNSSHSVPIIICSSLHLDGFTEAPTGVVFLNKDETFESLISELSKLPPTPRMARNIEIPNYVGAFQK